MSARRSVRAGWVGAGVTLAAAAGLLLGAPAPSDGRPTWNEPAPDLSLRLLDGSGIDLDDLAGRVVLVNFWATWCPPCRGEMRGFERVRAEWGEYGFEVVAIAVDAAGDRAVRDFVDRNGLTFPVAMATERVRRAWGGVSMLPQSFLVDREGRVRKIVRGAFDEAGLRRAVAELLEEP